MIITIDGPVATGKSTIAREVANSLGFLYLDTGAMYRAITYGIIVNKINVDDPQALSVFLHDFSFDMRIIQGHLHLFIKDEDITDHIRTLEVTSQVSKVAALSEVRKKLVAIQRHLSVGVNAVFEGRDMGSVVFPEAPVKVFLTGRPEVRARRRFEELKAKNPKEAAKTTLEKVLEDLNRRDQYDSTREHSPLIKPEGALVIDTSDLTVDEIVYKILEYHDNLRVDDV